MNATQIKTPAEIGLDLIFERFGADVRSIDKYDVRDLIAAAIDADRAQRDGNGRTAAFFQVGTLVRLTGASWDEYGIRGESVTVGVESFEGRRSENCFTHNGQHFILLKTDTDDYTATAILPTIGDKR